MLNLSLNFKSEELNLIFAKLKQRLLSIGPCYLAYSGGVDSLFLLHVFHLLEINIFPVHIKGVHVPLKSSESALAELKKYKYKPIELSVDLLKKDKVLENGIERCYHCKYYLFEMILSLRRKFGFLPVVDGTNFSDLKLYRPGLKALTELGILSPLAELKITKGMVKALVKKMQLIFFAKASRPCLLTRFDYNLVPDENTLFRIEEAEQELENFGFRDFRLRLKKEENNILVLLHVAWEEVDFLEVTKDKVQQILFKHGFVADKLEALAYLSGFFDE